MTMGREDLLKAKKLADVLSQEYAAKRKLCQLLEVDFNQVFKGSHRYPGPRGSFSCGTRRN